MIKYAGHRIDQLPTCVFLSNKSNYFYQIVEFCFLEQPFIHLHSIQEKLCVTYNGLKYTEKATLIRAKNVYMKKTWWLDEDRTVVTLYCDKVAIDFGAPSTRRRL